MPKLKSILPLLLLFTLTLTASIPPSNTNTPYAQVITESKNGTDVHYTYGNDLISNGSSFYLTDALGSTRGLVNVSEQLTDSYDYTPYGKLANHVGTSENNFLFTGEQFDKESDSYYLRARYYSPSSTRFMSRDTYDGTASSPITQNHYLYGNGNPITYVDPSGYAAQSMMSLTFSMAALGALSSVAISNAPSFGYGGANGALDSLSDHIRNGSGIGPTAIIYYITLAKVAIRNKISNTKIIPVVNYGSDFLGGHQGHIFDATFMMGSNGKFTSPVMHYAKRPKPYQGKMRRLINNSQECKNKLQGQACDEYPFLSTREGGVENYLAGNVSVRALPLAESGIQGNLMDAFYRKNGFYSSSGNKKFIVSPWFSKTFFITKDKDLYTTSNGTSYTKIY